MADKHRLHVLAFPFPAEGHINPMLNFAKRLVSEGLKVTLIIATSTKKSAQKQEQDLFTIEYISDGSGDQGEDPTTMVAYFKRLYEAMSKDLIKLVEKLKISNEPAKVIVYDSTMTWALDTAQQLGLLGASFFTESCAVSALYYQMHQGTLIIPPQEQSTVSIPGLPLLEIHDLPSFSPVMDSDQTISKFFSGQFSNVEKANWVLFNTFDKLENEVANWMSIKWPVKTIGPTVLKDNKHHGTCLIEMNSEICLNWLDKRDFRSVVYVSLGSVAILGEEQMEKLARGLIKSDCYFLWMVRASEECKLPVNFKSEIEGKGIIVNWCPQLEVLEHQAVACFMTHCGWNSTLEALSLGVPVIAMPQMIDQMTNAKFVADVWQAGVRVKLNDKGIVTGEEIEILIREVTQGEKGKELRANAENWKELAHEATTRGGSSYKNIDDFISEISSI